MGDWTTTIPLSQQWGFVTIDERDGLFPGWVAVTLYPHRETATRQFCMPSVDKAMAYVREIVRKSEKWVQVQFVYRDNTTSSVLVLPSAPC